MSAPPGRRRAAWLASPAKVNLGLRVLGLRPDGDHEVVTLVQLVDLCDRIRIRPGGRGLRVEVNRAGVPSGRANLAWRAADALRRRAGEARLGAEIFLEKHIPAGAGLGGGSGDAAAVLWALNRMWGLGLPASDLRRLGAGLGADIPAFLRGPAALCRGRGERTAAAPPLRRGWFVLVKPRLSLSTAAVYGWSREKLIREGKTPKILPRPKDIRAILYRNDLENVVFPRHPGLRACCGELRAAGAAQALMSGSGSALFGLFRRRGDAERAARRFSGRRGWRVFLAKPLAHPPFRAGCLVWEGNERGKERQEITN